MLEPACDIRFVRCKRRQNFWHPRIYDPVRTEYASEAFACRICDVLYRSGISDIARPAIYVLTGFISILLFFLYPLFSRYSLNFYFAKMDVSSLLKLLLPAISFVIAVLLDFKGKMQSRWL